VGERYRRRVKQRRVVTIREKIFVKELGGVWVARLL
jgi:hypothetical protein